MHFKILTDYNLKLVIAVENRYQCPKAADDRQGGYFYYHCFYVLIMPETEFILQRRQGGRPFSSVTVEIPFLEVTGEFEN